MKQRKVVPMIGALVVIISAVVLITGCFQPNSNKGNTGNNSGNISNNGGSLEVQPTGKSDPKLKGTIWKADTPHIFMQFAD